MSAYITTRVTCLTVNKLRKKVIPDYRVAPQTSLTKEWTHNTHQRYAYMINTNTLTSKVLGEVSWTCPSLMNKES